MTISVDRKAGPGRPNKRPLPPAGDRAPEDFHERLFELEARGELIVQRVEGDYLEVPLKYGRTKKVPIGNTWHHKSCGQCGHIPGYSTSIFWVNRRLGIEYEDPRDQTSCTAWNYYASATSNPAAQAAVAVRNFAAAHASGRFPIIHCGTSFGHYKEVRRELLAHDALRDDVRRVMDALGKPLVLPEELVHYSEWFHAMRHAIAAHQVRDFSGIAVSVHPACHYYKLVEGDAIYDPEVYGGQRTAIVTDVAQALGAEVRDYSTWFDCCGFGFRHILVQRDFSRSFATQRKIRRIVEEADPDVVLTHDTGCVTTLDKSQFAARAQDPDFATVPVMSEAQFAALAMGAHPYLVCQLHWHAAEYRPLLAKMGIDTEQAWAEFEAAVARLERGEQQFLTWEDVDV